ncbi:MAG: helix-turn-helix transcriptional regulator, partial [Clostridia bacterium]|nr:helix-turn-helix transcriptional regulator [Clostridia bacterium]
KSPIKNKNEILISVIQSLIFLLSTQNLPSIFAASATNKVKNISPDILKIIAYINANYNQPITLKTLSDKFYLSKVSLCKKFKKAMRCSIMDYVSHLRLNKAKSILRSQNKSMEEIAAECGYSSASYFYLTFKKQVGLSPSNYKKDQKIK